jgi:double-stranded uracil-DNA glycosylase
MSAIPSPFTGCPAPGLGPLAGEAPRVLVLGSFPSRKSLEHQEYYGNPKNHFWQIMDELFSIDRKLSYPLRTSRLVRQGIALWDVIDTCDRPGSADSRIRQPVFNGIGEFLTLHPTLRLIALNGSTAGKYYATLPVPTSVHSVVLPSTSPANARLSLEEKIKQWEVVRIACEE